MVRILFAVTILLGLAAAADAAICGVRGKSKSKVVHREKFRERGAGRTAPAMTGGGCVGTVGVTAVRAPVVAGGCSGYTGPALMIPPPAVIPVPLPPKK